MVNAVAVGAESIEGVEVILKKAIDTTLLPRRGFCRRGINNDNSVSKRIGLCTKQAEWHQQNFIFSNPEKTTLSSCQ